MHGILRESKETKEISNSNGFGGKLQRKNRKKKNNSTVLAERVCVFVYLFYEVGDLALARTERDRRRRSSLPLTRLIYLTKA